MTFADEHIIYNGELQPLQHSSLAKGCEQVFVYQDVHTLSHKPRHTAQHLHAIDIAARKLFSIESRLSVKGVEQDIERLLDANHTTRNTSVCVRLILYTSGDYAIQQHEASIYRGYVMRSLRYEATFIATTAPLSNYPTSALISTRTLLQQMAQARDMHYLIMTSPTTEVIAECCEPLMIIKEGVLYAPKFATPSVEQHLIECAAAKMGLKVEHTTLTVKQVQDADEVFISSWQGITALAHINEQPYMTTIAEQLSAQMEKQIK
jgi:branched-subunit amino acid aminotransferase/4-amino-4-deoxychorismate lyase